MEIDGVRKLVANLHDKEKYTVNYINLTKYLARGLKLKKIHCGIRFDQAPCSAATTDFEKSFFKLMNAVSSKTMENIRNQVDMRHVNSDKVARKLLANPNF